MTELYEGAVKVERFQGFGMLTLRGDFKKTAFQTAVEDALAPIPGQRQITVGDTGMLAWMSPDELLAVVPLEAAEDISNQLNHALKGVHALVLNVSDARAVFRVSGAGARDVLAKGAPVDMSPSAFGPGQIRRTRLGQVACAFWMSDADKFDLICFQSVSGYLFDWLSMAARKDSLPNFL